MLDLISRGAQGHGPVHLLLISAAELGFAWDGAEKGWIRVSLPPFENDDWSCAAFLFFYSACHGVLVFLPSYLRGRTVGELSMLILRALYNYTYLVPPAGTR